MPEASDFAYDTGSPQCRPEVVAEVEYRGWTGDGLLRHASFFKGCEDKDPREVTREEALEPPPKLNAPSPAPTSPRAFASGQGRLSGCDAGPVGGH